MNLLEAPDVINLLDGIFGKWTRGGGVYLEFSRYSDWRGVDTESLLASYGVPVYGRYVEGEETFGFYVKPKQAEWADYLLRTAGAPIISKPLSERNAAIPREGGKLPKAWGTQTKPKTFVDWTVRLMAWFLDAWEPSKSNPFWKRGR